MAKILATTQLNKGRESTLHSVIPSNLRAEPLSAPLHTLAAATDDLVVRAPAFASPISLMRDLVTGGLVDRLGSPAIIHLHGINGAISLDAIAERWPEVRVVWTLHDMNPFTGACHYSLGCAQYEANCDACPAVRGPFRARVSLNLERKTSELARIKNLSLVAPSSWLADQASRSSALRGNDITVIPNPVNPAFSGPPAPSKKSSAAPFRIAVVAQNLADPIKNVATSVAAFHRLGVAKGHAELVLVGQGGEAFQGPGVILEGVLPPQELSAVLSRCDSLLVSSLAENAPLAIAEGASLGLLPIVRDVGGMPEMVTMLGHGETFTSDSELDAILAREVRMTQQAREKRRSAIRLAAANVWGVDSVVALYDKVYGS